MSPANADIIGAFPNPTIDPITGLPNYDSISAVHLQLNQNTASVDCHLGDGINGLLLLTVSTAIYITISNELFDVPTNLGPNPIVQPTGTEHQIKEAYRVHSENTRIWREFQATDKSLKQLLLGAVRDIYTSALKHRVTGYANVSTRRLMEHLYSKYGNITAGDLEANEQRMKTPFAPNKPIEALYTQLESAIDLADAAGTPYSVNQLVTTAYNLVFKKPQPTTSSLRRASLLIRVVIGAVALPPTKLGSISKPTSLRQPKIFENRPQPRKPLATMAPTQPWRKIRVFNKKPLQPSQISLPPQPLIDPRSPASPRH
jgi:hypothetical protein